MKLFIVGISGVSGSGKSALATKLYDHLSDPTNANAYDNCHIKQVLLIQQDKYMYPRGSPHHIWIKDRFFEVNGEVLSAIDVEGMWSDIEKAVSRISATKTNRDCNANDMCILLLEGFLIFNDERINALCNVRLHLTLTREVCLERRLKRVWQHDNPQPIKYFQEYVWPLYQMHRDLVQKSDQIHYMNGENSQERLFEQTLHIIAEDII